MKIFFIITISFCMIGCAASNKIVPDDSGIIPDKPIGIEDIDPIKKPEKITIINGKTDEELPMGSFGE